MEFAEATDRLMADGVSLEEIADALGVAYTTVRAYRLDPASPSYRSPPVGWPPKLVKLAKGRGRSLAKLAEQLEREG